jgi:hypothetical protein
MSFQEEDCNNKVSHALHHDTEDGNGIKELESMSTSICSNSTNVSNCVTSPPSVANLVTQ